jgi:manganese/zinc/iron transport system permease protein
MIGIGYNTLIVLLGATALGGAAGMLGCFMVLRRQALVSDALAHATLPGLVLAFLIGAAMGAQDRSLPLLLFGATCGGVAAIAAIAAMSRWTRIGHDAAIGAVMSSFFGAGVVLLSIAQELPYAGSAGLKTFLLGQTAAMRASEALALASLAGLVATMLWLFYKEFRLLAFDPAFARAAGWPMRRFGLILNALIIIVTVAGLQTTGLALIIALLITPAAAARLWTDRLAVMIPISGSFGAISGGFGAYLSSLYPHLPTGAVIALMVSGIFLFSLLIAPQRGALALVLRRRMWRREDAAVP